MVERPHFSRLLALLLAARSVAAAGLGWHFVQNGTSGIVALETMVISETTALFFDRGTNAPLQIDGHSAWGAFWNLETNTASPLRLVSDTLCASGGFLSNGTIVGIHSDFNLHSIDSRLPCRLMLVE